MDISNMDTSQKIVNAIKKYDYRKLIAFGLVAIIFGLLLQFVIFPPALGKILKSVIFGTSHSIMHHIQFNFIFGIQLIHSRNFNWNLAHRCDWCTTNCHFRWYTKSTFSTSPIPMKCTPVENQIYKKSAHTCSSWLHIIYQLNSVDSCSLVVCIRLVWIKLTTLMLIHWNILCSIRIIIIRS